MRLINWILLSPFALIAISFAISNREEISLTLWPFPFELQIPLALLAFILLLLGFFAGGIAAWLGGHKSRLAARANKKQLSEQSREIGNLKAELASFKTDEEAVEEASQDLLDDTDDKTQLPAPQQQTEAPSKWSAS